MIFNFEPPIFIRRWLIVLIAGMALGLVSVTLNPQGGTIERTPEEFVSAVHMIDRAVDSLLTQFQIEKAWCKKRQVPITGTNISRIERRVTIPPEIIPVQMNQALNLIARQHGGRAIGSENPKENSVTLHIKLERQIVETIILKTTKDLKRGPVSTIRKKK